MTTEPEPVQRAVFVGCSENPSEQRFSGLFDNSRYNNRNQHEFLTQDVFFWQKVRITSSFTIRLKNYVNQKLIVQRSMISEPYYEKGTRSSGQVGSSVRLSTGSVNWRPESDRTTGALFEVWYTYHTALVEK